MFGYPLSTGAAVTFALIAFALLAEAARRARWSAPAGEHLIWALATAAVLIGHRMNVRLESGLELHYLGAAFLALLLGYPRALVSMAVVLAVDGVLGWGAALGTTVGAATVPDGAAGAPFGGLSTWGLRMLLAGVLPVWVRWLIVEAARRWLPRNPFVFLLGCGLLGLFVAYGVELVATALVYRALAPELPRDFVEDFVPYALLLAAGEAWLEGMLTTLLVVYVPGSVRLFDEAFYLRRA